MKNREVNDNITPYQEMIIERAFTMSYSSRNAEKMRGELALAYISNTEDPGRWGRAFELIVALDKSRKARVSKQGQVDVYIKVRNAAGKVEYVPAEVKTNGGRVEELLMGSKAQYVIYQMEGVAVPQGKKAKAEGRPVEFRNVPAVVIPKALFLAKLQEFNAIKAIAHGGEVDGYGIQVTSKRWYEWLVEYPVVFQQGYTYEAWEFEGLE